MVHSDDCNLIQVSRRFFVRARIIHLVLSILMLGNGVVALVLSYGSNGDAQVPYFFSAYICWAWHLSFVAISSVCVYYLHGDGERSVGVNSWVSVFSINSSVFVLFNVMGVVFAVVNGLCIRGQQCYYDRHEDANRFMAILLVLFHCVSILANVLLAKRSHLISSQFQHDVSVKFIHTMAWLRRKRSRKVSMTSALPSQRESSVDTSVNSSSSPTQRGQTPTLTEVRTSKSGVVMTTIEISAMRKTHRRTKSHPNMLKNIDLKPDDMEGTVYSIYSDSEMIKTEESKKKKIGLFRKRKKNKVDSESVTSSTKDESVASPAEKFAMKTTLPVQPVLYAEDSTDDIFVVKPVGGAWEQDSGAKHDSILAEQRQLQRKQEEVLQMQKKLMEQQQTFMATVKSNLVAPPPYEAFAKSAESDGESSV